MKTFYIGYFNRGQGTYARSRVSLGLGTRSLYYLSHEAAIRSEPEDKCRADVVAVEVHLECANFPRAGDTL